MIDIKRAKRFCKEYWKIENYEKAVSDTTQTWQCHHRLETEHDCFRPSKSQLIDNGLYYDRPADELIFLTTSEHHSLHQKGKNNTFFGKHHTKESKRKISLKIAGNNHPLYGKHHNEETKQKISKANKGHKSWNGGKVGVYSNETLQKMRESHKGKMTGKHWRLVNGKREYY